MLSAGTKYKLFQFIQIMSENETLIEEQRQELARIEEFEPWAAFRRLCQCSDDPSRNAINAEDLCRFLR